MFTKQQLAHRLWLRETQRELEILKDKLNGDTNAVISSLINGSALKFISK